MDIPHQPYQQIIEGFNEKFFQKNKQIEFRIEKLRTIVCKSQAGANTG